MNNKGFSMVQVMIAAGLVIVIGAGAFYYLSINNVEIDEESDEPATSLEVPIPGNEDVDEMIVTETGLPTRCKLDELATDTFRGLTIISPNGVGECAINSEILIEFFVDDSTLSQLTNRDVVQLYLVTGDNVVGGIGGIYVKDPEVTDNLLREQGFPEYYMGTHKELLVGRNVFIWNLKKTFSNAGLEDRAFTSVNTGLYKIMVLARKPIFREGGEIGDYGERFGSRLIEGEIMKLSDEDFYIASDLSDSFFEIK